MKCPFCKITGTRPELHLHLTDKHDEEVLTEQDSWGRRFMQLSCPECDEFHRQQVKPRSNDPDFLEAHYREIRLVAFDLFLYHWGDDHSEETTHE
ncbi:MAG: hypothetical protein ABFR95_03555 [Actinomycetota bacterium]